MKKVVKLTEKQLTKIIKKIINEASLTTPDTWAKLNNVQGRQVLISSDGGIAITNRENKAVKIRFAGKVMFTSIDINVGRVDETESGITITTKQSKRQTYLTPNHVSTLLAFVDNPKQSKMEFVDVSVKEPDSNELKKGTIIASKV